MGGHGGARHRREAARAGPQRRAGPQPGRGLSPLQASAQEEWAESLTPNREADLRRAAQSTGWDFNSCPRPSPPYLPGTSSQVLGQGWWHGGWAGSWHADAASDGRHRSEAWAVVARRSEAAPGPRSQPGFGAHPGLALASRGLGFCVCKRGAPAVSPQAASGRVGLVSGV